MRVADIIEDALFPQQERLERSRDQHRQETSLLHLHHRVLFQMFAPLPIFHRLGTRRWRSLQQRLRKLAAQRVIHERRRIGDYGRNFLVQSRLVAATENELATKSVARRLASPSGTPMRKKPLAFITSNNQRKMSQSSRRSTAKADPSLHPAARRDGVDLWCSCVQLYFEASSCDLVLE
jgi:hypothetical protein